MCISLYVYLYVLKCIVFANSTCLCIFVMFTIVPVQNTIEISRLLVMNLVVVYVKVVCGKFVWLAWFSMPDVMQLTLQCYCIIFCFI